MRPESSTVVVLVGAVGEELLAELGRSPNVSIARAPGAGAGQPVAEEPPAFRPGLGRQAPWRSARRPGECRRMWLCPMTRWPMRPPPGRAMWDVVDTRGAAEFEERAADALAAWRDKRFELPDYYLVVAPVLPDGTGPDLYLGPLRAARPRRVAAAGLDRQPRPGRTGAGCAQVVGTRAVVAAA